MPPRGGSDVLSPRSRGDRAANPLLSPREVITNMSLSPLNITNMLLSPRRGAFTPSLSPHECISTMKATVAFTVSVH